MSLLDERNADVVAVNLQDGAEYHVQDSRTSVKNTWVLNTEAHPLKVAGKPV